MRAERTLNVGMIGCGFIGKVHSFSYLNLPMYYEPPPATIKLLAVCTAHEETARAAAERFGYRVATTDFRQVTDDPDVDVVNICTPNRQHREQLLAAIAAGKHIYCDKPLTASAAEAREVVAAMDGYTGTHQVTFHNRFYPATLQAKELADGGFLGDVLTFRAAYLHAGSVDPDRPFGWRFSKEIAGGGALYDLGAHTIDLVRHLVGEFADVCCATSIAHPDRPSPDDPSKRVPVDADDAAFMLVRTESGALGSIESSRTATGTQDELRFEIHGSRGAMRFNLMDPNWLDVCDLTADRPGWTRLPTVQDYPGSGGFIPGKASIGWVRAHVACLQNFVAAAARGEPAEPGLDVGARVQEIMDAGYRSAESGGWVPA
ncbi:MAG: Gfo/Idh/MocA family oxidoreductase [Planctomycetota bacterium]